MHKALLVNEIVFRILGSIVDDPPSSYNRGYTTRRTALHLGRTCRTMMDPAMDVVWEGVRDFSVLFRLLPADSWQANAAGGVTIIRTVTKADWQRFEYYGSRVRRLYYRATDLSHSCLSEINSSNSNTTLPILPD
ncbi:hypothetical protein HGRIS_001103 [Hohenbuehelia grisea]|uniref:Uncharacterized protein n=1 Tax=Hohenbuehelia grisea TaxID=104357 RepID=A0ABR3JN91_9AGAR